LNEERISSSKVNPPIQSTVAAEGLRSRQSARRYVWERKVTTVEGVITYLELM
jgi:hypothetical protein